MDFSLMQIQDSHAVRTYLENVKVMSSSTAYQYKLRLHSFSKFTMQRYKQRVDTLINAIKMEELNVYEVLAAYASYLLYTGTISSLTLTQWVVTAKNLLEFYDIDITPKKFKFKVRLPKAIRKNKEALTKEFVADILNSVADIRLLAIIVCYWIEGNGGSFDQDL